MIRQAHPASQPPDSATQDAIAVAVAIAFLLVIAFLASVIPGVR